MLAGYLLLLPVTTFANTKINGACGLGIPGPWNLIFFWLWVLILCLENLCFWKWLFVEGYSGSNNAFGLESNQRLGTVDFRMRSGIIPLFLFCLFCWERISLFSPSWPWTHHPPMSASIVLRLQVCTAMPSFCSSISNDWVGATVAFCPELSWF